jgi:hypothetical protein
MWGAEVAALTWFFDDPDSLPAQPSYHLPWPLRIMFPIPPGAPQPPCQPAVLREDDGVLACLRVGRVPSERDAFVDFHDGAVEWRGAADVEVEDAGAGLVAYEEEVLERSLIGVRRARRRKKQHDVTLKPFVMMRACLCPLRSRSAFVATVVERRM